MSALKRAAVLVSAAAALAGAPTALAGDDAGSIDEVSIEDLLPVEWVELERLVERSDVPPAGPFRLSQARAWGDPSSGCYALLQSAYVESRSASVEGLHRGFARGLELQGFELEKKATVAEGDRAASSLKISGHGVRGRSAVISIVDAEGFASARALTCFWNPRDENRSMSRCEQLLAQFEAIK